MDGIPDLDLLDVVTEVLHSSSNQPKKFKENVQGMTHQQERLEFSTTISNYANHQGQKSNNETRIPNPQSCS